jgi:hypothetical protein
MQKKKQILVIAVIAVLASVGLVAADEAGIVTINIFNSPNSQINTTISNSTIMGETNYTNSQAYQNITLTNSTLTLNINGQNVTISSSGDGLTITGPSQNPTNPNPVPTLSVAFLKSGPNERGIFQGNTSASVQYDFNVTVNVATSFNYPFGKNVSHDKIVQAVAPLASKYNLATNNYRLSDGTTITSSVWANMQVVDGENVFSLFGNNTLSAEQIKSLTADLFGALTQAMQG